MNKNIQAIKKSKLSPLIIMLITIFVISIFGIKLSKISAQENISSLSSDLRVVGFTNIGNSLIINGNVGINHIPTTQYKLTITGNANFTEVVYADTPGDNQIYALATVEYLKYKLGEYVGIMPGENW